jgi:hypothetical protein
MLFVIPIDIGAYALGLIGVMVALFLGGLLFQLLFGLYDIFVGSSSGDAQRKRDAEAWLNRVMPRSHR